MKIIIDIQGCLYKPDQSEITEQQYEDFYDKFIELVEQENYAFGGGLGHVTEKQYLKQFDDEQTYKTNTFNIN